MSELRALAVCGSIRKDSHNLKLLNIAKLIAEESGVMAITADLKALNLPPYNFDVEASGFPDNVIELSNMVKAADIFLIACPEYNYSVTGVLKNAIDWVSRIRPNPFSGKVAAIFGASTGIMGTARAQHHLRQILTTINVLVLPQPQVHVALAESAFESDGALKNKTAENQLKELLQKTFDLAKKIK
jgi:chromate reductase